MRRALLFSAITMLAMPVGYGTGLHPDAPAWHRGPHHQQWHLESPSGDTWEQIDGEAQSIQRSVVTQRSWESERQRPVVIPCSGALEQAIDNAARYIRVVGITENKGRLNLAEVAEYMAASHGLTGDYIQIIPLSENLNLIRALCATRISNQDIVKNTYDFLELKNIDLVNTERAVGHIVSFACKSDLCALMQQIEGGLVVVARNANNLSMLLQYDVSQNRYFIFRTSAGNVSLRQIRYKISISPEQSAELSRLDSLHVEEGVPMFRAAIEQSIGLQEGELAFRLGEFALTQLVNFGPSKQENAMVVGVSATNIGCNSAKCVTATFFHQLGLKLEFVHFIVDKPSDDVVAECEARARLSAS